MATLPDIKFKATKFGNQPITATVNGRLCHFKSKLEYRWAQYLDFLKTIGEIKDFFYEFHTFRFSDDCKVKEYTPDFLVRLNDNEFEYHETKGMLSGYDTQKFKAVWDERPYVKIVIIFAAKPKISSFKNNQLNRYCSRIIVDANKLFKQVPHFDGR